MTDTTARKMLAMLDLTSLGSDDRDEDIVDLCRRADTPHGSVATVCVWPRFVSLAAEQLADSPVGICAVANFPEGADDVTRAIHDAEAIVSHGASEVDVVVPWRNHLGGDPDAVRHLVAAVRSAIGPDVGLKAILETGEIGDVAVVRSIAVEAIIGGADFLKTSTGKTATSATIEAATVLLEVVAEHGETSEGRTRPVGVKVSGGIGDRDTAARYLTLADRIMGPTWADPSTFRFGASRLLDDLLRAIDLDG